MDSVFQANATMTVPAVPSSESSKGNPTNGSPQGGQPATIIGDRWFYMMTQEPLTVVKAAGLEPDANDCTQLFQAISILIAKSVNGAVEDLNKKITDVGEQIKVGIPTGTIFAFDRNTPPDEYWLPCDGRAVSRTAYPELFAAIGTRHGDGNGSTTFNLPNLIGRALEGATSGIGEYVPATVPNPFGRVANFNAYTTQATANGAFYAVPNGGFVGVRQGSWDAANEIFFDASRVSSVYKNGVNTVKVDAMKVLYCIHI